MGNFRNRQRRARLSQPCLARIVAKFTLNEIAFSEKKTKGKSMTTMI
jgi:hypothetical protein